VLAQQKNNKKRRENVDNFTHMGSRDRPPILMNFGLLGCPTDVMSSTNFALIAVGVFCEVLKMAISYT
jgi:hypothetical protein